MDHLERIPSDWNRRSESGRVSLNEIQYGSPRFYKMGELKLTIRLMGSQVHPYNQLCISTDSLNETEHCLVEMEFHNKDVFPGKRYFWHLFEASRNTFCIPFVEIRPQWQYGKDKMREIEEQAPTEGVLEKTRNRGAPYIRFVVGQIEDEENDPVEWSMRNCIFPFADLVLNVGNDELYVNRKLIISVSRLLCFHVHGSRLKQLDKWEVLHLTNIEFDDLYDIVGHIYHDWPLEIYRSLHLQSVTEILGISFISPSSYDFEGRTNLDFVSKGVADMIAKDSIQKYVALTGNIVVESKENSVFSDVFRMIPNIQEQYSDVEVDSNDSRIDEDMEMEPPDTPSYPPSSNSTLLDTPIRSPMQTPSPINSISPTYSLFSSNGSEYEEFKLFHCIKMEKNNGIQFPSSFIDDGSLNFEGQNGEGEFHFDFNLDYDQKKCRGQMEGIETSVIKWQMYLYKKTLNSQKYLSLGIHVDHMAPHRSYEFSLKMRMQGNNVNIQKKLLTFHVDETRKTYGYPDFLPWSEVVNCKEKMSFAVHIHLKVFPRSNQLVIKPIFPGRKDVLLEIDGKMFPVSKDVISDASPVLRKLFHSNFLVNRAKVYKLEKVKYSDFSVLVDIIYHRHFAIKNRDIIHSVLLLAFRLKIPFAVQLIFRHAISNSIFTRRDVENYRRMSSLVANVSYFFDTLGYNRPAPEFDSLLYHNY